MKAREGRQKIMVVDDTPLNIKILGELLEPEYEVCFATKGEDALRILESAKPDLFLLDIVMPGFNGFELCLLLKQDPLYRETPVIFITAKNDPGDEIKGLQLGAVDFITKPFNAEIVRLRIRNHLELKRLRDAQAELAFVDGLTGIPNRRAFDQNFAREWLRAKRQKSVLSVILIDIDHFKVYNDHFGHLAGDDCLKTIARGLDEEVLRPADFVARYGGEEFAVVLAETDLARGIEVAERLRARVEKLSMTHSPGYGLVTISLGLASAMPTSELEPETVLKAADQALYRAKEEGRNRSVGGVQFE